MNDRVPDANYLLKDLLQGYDDVFERTDFQALTYHEIKLALDTILNNPNLPTKDLKDLSNNLWRIHYKQKPPTIDEFLTESWLGASALGIYPHVKKDLVNFLNPSSPYRHLLLAGCIGYGKSFISAVAVLYILTQCNLMRDPKKFFGLNASSSIVAVLGSFTLAKAKQLLLKPFYNILQTSERFRRVKNEDRIDVVQKEEPNKIVWTTASKMDGAIQFSNDLHILIVSDVANLLGLSVLVGVLSEISFWLDKGVSPDEIDRMYNDLKGRVWSRFNDRYLSATIMDSSPNSFDSPVDKYIFSGEAEKDPLNLVVKSTHWEAHPSKYPLWLKSGETFPVFRGSGSQPPKVVQNSDELKNFIPDEIYNVPVDVRKLFDRDLKKAVKDYCGYPAGSDDKLIDNFYYIENMFTNQLKNLEAGIIVPANKPPEKLIWSQVVDQFFIKTGSGSFEFYRSPYEIRYIHIDQSEVSDMTGITMSHPEIDTKTGEIVIIIDFTIAIIPTKDRINLDAIFDFLIDLKNNGVKIGKVTFDRHQSAPAIQRLQRDNINVAHFSVDSSTAPYYTAISYLKNGRIKSGKNIFLKNNLKSLMEISTDSGKRKIDHLKGKLEYYYNNDWEKSAAGINAKDVSDSWAGSVYHSITEYKGVPRYQFTELILNNDEDYKIKYKETCLQNVESKFGLILFDVKQ